MLVEICTKEGINFLLMKMKKKEIIALVENFGRKTSANVLLTNHFFFCFF